MSRRLYLRESNPAWRKPLIPSGYTDSFRKTLAMRHSVPRDLRPLFNHILGLSLHSYRSGYPQRAGIELRQARKLGTVSRRSR